MHFYPPIMKTIITAAGHFQIELFNKQKNKAPHNIFLYLITVAKSLVCIDTAVFFIYTSVRSLSSKITHIWQF